MDIRQLETLIAVADTGSFAAAARLVNLTSSAVSQQIQSLESEMGVQLFDRSKRPPRLNGKGEDFLRTARNVVQTMTEARVALSGGRTSGVLKFGAIRTVSTRFMPQAFAEMRRVYPDLAFNLSVGLSEKLMSDVGAGRLDAALVAEHVGVPSSLAWHPVIEEPLVLVAPPGTADETETELMRRLPFIRYETDVPLARQITTELSRLAIAPREVAVANTMPAVVGLVEAGLGFAVVPRIAYLDARSERLVCRPFGRGQISRRLGLVHRQNSTRSKTLATLRGILSDQGGALSDDAA
ncbi:HTH-type transcriptional regulator GltR [Roseivivax sp. THAF40]|uniref:LysR family transcriptional regulator n=1 Tax=unclassified Roseivivax TaxID=2639302 RepID=UPI001267F503|nr:MULTISPECIES: LysR family transcriptional regulator [unclassified Roseivivax]QFS82535.1 HTH-type transcriptional regulator GltR [Roseivivax sp. THAF197b]QFT46304.1 HTH-type transcriptional regulator GltR [Roseivivax sp. THAF40]